MTKPCKSAITYKLGDYPRNKPHDQGNVALLYEEIRGFHNHTKLAMLALLTTLCSYIFDGSSSFHIS